MQEVGDELRREWWGLMVTGIVAILFGIVAMAWPGLTVAVFALLFAILLLVFGVVDIVNGVRGMGQKFSKILQVILGVAEVAVAVYLLDHASKGLAVSLVALLVGLSFIVRGVIGVFLAFDRESSTTVRWLSALGGIFAIIVALIVIRHPERKRIYIANFGNGGTAYFDKKEQDYIRKTGRYTIGDPATAVALPSIQALHRALEHNDIHITRFSGVSAGNTVALALMNELPNSQVTDAYLKGALGTVDFLWPRLTYEMLVTENILNGRRNKRESTDNWKPDSIKNDLAKIALYSLRNKDVLQRPEEPYKVNARQKAFTDVLSFTRGPKQGDPLATGIAAALNHQTEVLITLHCGTGDVLYDGRTLEVISGLLERAAALGGVALVEPRLQALVINGSHADHTYEPSKRMAIESAVFQRSVTRPQSVYRAKSPRQSQWYRQS